MLSESAAVPPGPAPRGRARGRRAVCPPAVVQLWAALHTAGTARDRQLGSSYAGRMRSNEIFARMSTERAVAFLEEVKREARPVAQIALGAAAQAFRLRPEFLRRQPKQRQAEWMRKALGRTVGAPLAEELLATYFLEHHLDLLKEWLDLIGIEHEEGQIQSESLEAPAPDVLRGAVEQFRKGDQPERRELLLLAFAAQSAVDWPELESLLGVSPA